MSFFSNRRQVELPPSPSQTGERAPAVTVSAQQPVGFETVLGANSIMEGHLRSSANVRLDGTFTGTLEISGNVLVGETARITADINARNISIAGAVRGNVSGKKVQILRTGRIWGDIHAQALTTEEGAFIDGKITMTRSDITDAIANETLLQATAAPANVEQSAPTEAEIVPPSATSELADAGQTAFVEEQPPVAPPITSESSATVESVLDGDVADDFPDSDLPEESK